MKKTFIFLFACLYNISLFAQDTYFSQYNTSKTYINPAFTGTDSTWTLSSATRFQWLEANQGYRTYFFSADNYFHRLRGGLGLNYMHENQLGGIFKKTRIDLNYAPHFELFDHRLVVQAGVQFSYFNVSADWSKLKFGDTFNSSTGFTDNTREVAAVSQKSNVDASGGLLFYTKRFYGGFSVHHIPQPDEGLIGLSRLQAKFTWHAGMNIYLGRLVVSPHILYMKQEDFDQLLIGISGKYKWLTASVSYQDQQSICAGIGLQNHFFKISYSYDQSIAQQTYSFSGSHEIHLNWYIRHRKACTIRTLRLI